MKNNEKKSFISKIMSNSQNMYAIVLLLGVLVGVLTNILKYSYLTIRTDIEKKDTYVDVSRSQKITLAVLYAKCSNYNLLLEVGRTNELTYFDYELARQLLLSGTLNRDQEDTMKRVINAIIEEKRNKNKGFTDKKLDTIDLDIGSSNNTYNDHDYRIYNER